MIYSAIGKVITVSGSKHEHGLVTLAQYDSRYIEVPIQTGENHGRILLHNNVVRDVEHIGWWNGGSQDFILPALTQKEGCKRAILLSAGPGGVIIGAICL